MRQTIRLNTFETNSSSMHSLVVVKEPIFYTEEEKHLNCDSEFKSFDLFDFDDGRYERFPFRVFKTPKDKLKYWVAYYIGTLGKKELIPQVIDFISKQTFISKDKINICVSRGEDSLDEDLSDEDYYFDKYGRVCSNDTGESPSNYLDKHNISMEEFVLNPKYILILDGDEYCEFYKLIKSGVVNLDNLEDITSGKDFWDPKVYKAQIYWFIDDNIFEQILCKDLSQYTKIIIDDWDTSDDLNKAKINLNYYIDYVKEYYPNINIILYTNRLNDCVDAKIKCNISQKI